jgi:hypothetical protein
MSFFSSLENFFGNLGQDFTPQKNSLLGGIFNVGQTPTPTQQQGINEIAQNLPSGGTTTQEGATVSGNPFAGFGPWLVAFAVLAGGMILLSEGEGTMSEVGYALLILIVFSYLLSNFDNFTNELNNLFGVNINPSSTSTSTTGGT